MLPAFSSKRQAAAFVLLLLGIILSPVIMQRLWLPPRKEIYGWLGWLTTGAHPYQYQQIFVEKGDIDIAILGSSHLWFDLDARYIQDKLSEKLGRKAVVRTIGWGGSGFDILELYARDLLSQRRVRMLVFYDETQLQTPPPLAPEFFRFSEQPGAFEGMPLKYRASYFMASILGMPKNLLALLRSNLPAIDTPDKIREVETLYASDYPKKSLGSRAEKHGYWSPKTNFYSSFEEYKPVTGASPSDAVIYSPETKTSFDFGSGEVPAWQLNFARRFAALARRKQTALVLLHTPFIDETASNTV